MSPSISCRLFPSARSAIRRDPDFRAPAISNITTALPIPNSSPEPAFTWAFYSQRPPFWQCTLLYKRHFIGFQIRLAGESLRAAAYAGVKVNWLVVFCLGAGGGLAGLAGIMELSGPTGQLSIDFNVGYGFTAIIVAFLGRLHPVGITLAGILMALTYIGGELAQFMLGLPAASIQAFQGMLLFFLLALDFLSTYRVRIQFKKTEST